MTSVVFKFNFGDLVKEKISGFTGKIVGMYHYDTGCKHYGVAPIKLKDGKIGDTENCNEERLILIKSSMEKPRKAKAVSGPMDKSCSIKY